MAWLLKALLAITCCCVVATAQDEEGPFGSLNCEDPSEDVVIQIFETDEPYALLWEGSEAEACELLALEDLCRRRQTKDKCETGGICVIFNPDGTQKYEGTCKWVKATDGNGGETESCNCVKTPGGMGASPHLVAMSMLSSLVGLFLLTSRFGKAA